MKLRCVSVWIAIISMMFNGTAFGEDRTVTFSTTDTGVTKSISNWGYDTAWGDTNNMRRCIIFMGNTLNCVRIAPATSEQLINGSNLSTCELTQADKTTMSATYNLVRSLTPNAKWYLCCGDAISNWYISGTNRLYPDRFAAMWTANVRYLNTLAYPPTISWIDLANEPDYIYVGAQGSAQDYYNTLGYLLGRSEFSDKLMGGCGTLNSDEAVNWFSPLVPRASLGSTHNLAGTAANYVNFLQYCTANNAFSFEPEVHNVGECIMGANYGLNGVIWWGPAELARGEFAKASQGKRLGYAEHLPNWTAAAVYRTPNGKIQAFVGEAERTCLPTTYEFYCTDRPVFYDGYGPQRSFTVATSGGSEYGGDSHKNAERVVNITWGDDIQPVINGRYVLVNRNSRKVMEVAGASIDNGANIQQNAYDNTKLNQQWDFVPQDYLVGGDWSYFKVTAAHSGRTPDVSNFSLDNGGNVMQWGYGENANEHWYLDYVEDGWFYIRSRWSAKCLDVAGSSVANGANIQQWDVLEGLNQQWRLLPVGAAIEFVAPVVVTGIAASANPVSVKLTWNANSESDLDGYTVLRSTTSGGPYEIIARGITTTSFTDNSANQPLPYYYVVKAVDKSLNRSANSAQASATPTGSATLVAQYSFNGNLVDDSINANDAMANGAVGYGTRNVGSDSLDLDPSSGCVSVPAQVVNFDDITISSWIYWDGGSQWQRIFDFGNDTNYYMFLTPRSGSNTLRFAIKNGGSEQIVETTQLAAAQWVHVAVTLGGTTARLYVDGILRDTDTNVTINPSQFNPALNYIGRSQFSDPLFSGQIDDFRIYNYALSGTQIAAIKTGNTPPSFTSDPIGNSGGIELKSYTGGSLASYAFSPDGDALTFSKDSGPEWLTVASDGTLSGTPLNANVGPNTFTVRVTNSTGLYDTATMTIEVANIYSGVAGVNDLLGLASQWLASGCTDTPACDGADMDGDADVDLEDFSELAFYWLVPEDLQLDLKLDETSGTTAADSSLYGRPGILTNGPAWSSGHTGGALSFDGTNDYVQVTGYQGVTGADSRTCCAWIKTTTAGAVMSWGRSVPTGGDYWYCLVNYSASGNPGALHVSVLGGNVVGTTDLRNGQWHHIAVVFDSDSDPDTSDLTLYVDGIAETVSYLALRAIDTAADTDVYLGSRLGGTSYLFSGLMDEVRIYNRALTATEIQAIVTP